MAWIQRTLGLASVAAWIGQEAQLTNNRGPTCSSPELSCHNSSTVDDLCCFNAPGGTLLLTQFWDTHPPTGPEKSWTLHGLWPDNCDGSYEAYCDNRRNYHNITGILQEASNETLEYMQTYWKDYKGDDETFWQHEWGKHGTCVSTLNPTCFDDYKTAAEVVPFFEKAVSLFKALPSYEWLKQAGIEPSRDKTYSFDEIESALSSHFEGHEVRLGCHYGQLNEIWYFYNVRGSLQDGIFFPTDRIGSFSTCPKTGIKYLPKRSSHTQPPGGPTRAPDPPGRAFTGRGQLNVVRSGNKKGCLISKGGWYVSGTCATFVAQRDGDEFGLKSLKGSCGVKDGALFCGSNVAPARFEADGRLLSFNGSTSFSADEAAHGRRSEIVYVGNDHEIEMQLVWA